MQTCFATLAGDTGDGPVRPAPTVGRAAAAFREGVRRDDDFAAVPATCGSNRLFALERARLDFRRAETEVCPTCGYPWVTFANSRIGGAALGLVVISALWWLYFDVAAIFARRELVHAEGVTQARLARERRQQVRPPRRETRNPAAGTR